MQDVASAAGVTKAALYYHFADKQDLFTTVSLLQIERILGSLEEAAGGGGSLEERLARLVAVGQERLEVDVYRPHFQAHEHLDAVHHQQLHDAMDRLQEPVIRCFEEAGPRDPAVSPRVAATMLGGLLASLIFFADEPGREDPLPGDRHERVDLAVSLFVHGYDALARGQAGNPSSSSPDDALPPVTSSSSASRR